MKEEISSLRAEHSETYLLLQNEKQTSTSLKSQISIFAAQVENMDGKITSLQRENNDLRQKLVSSGARITSLEQKLCNKTKAYEENITALKAEKSQMLDKCNAQKREIGVLRARSKQLQFGAQQSIVYDRDQKKKHQTKKEKVDDFEVQKLIEHKIIRKERHFLVRWKGYDPSEDSWVAESRLNRPKILKSYLKSENSEH